MTKAPVSKPPTIKAPKKASGSRWRRRFFRSPLAKAGFVVIVGFLIIVAFAPFLAPYSPTSESLRVRYVPPFTGLSTTGPDGQFGLFASPVTRFPDERGIVVDENQKYPVRLFVRGQPWQWFGGLIRSDLRLFGADGPARVYLLGTDDLGRDILSRLIHGAWISLFIGIIAVSIGVGIGVPLGAISGYYGGRVDMIIQRIVDTMLAFPGILLAIVLVATLGTGLTNVMIAVGIASIPVYARLVRGSIMSIRNQEYIEAARALGKHDLVILTRHAIPNALAPVIVQSSLQMAVAILFAAGLGFLGLGARPPQPEWGLMLATGRNYLATAPHMATFPGLAIMLVVLGFNLVGDALRDALDPRMK